MLKGLVGFVLAGMMIAGCITINLPPPTQELEEKIISGRARPKIALVDISGMISDESSSGTLQQKPSMLATLKEIFDKIADDDDVKAVVLRINSPGGTVTASDIIHHEIQRLKSRTGKKMVASIMGIGASGGYYIAAAADRIVAHPTSVTGSIGVIMLTINVEGLLEKIGIEGTAIKSGARKDMGSPFRPMTDEERHLFQAVIDEMYDRFVSVVIEGRPGMNGDQVRAAADGRIYTGPQALELGLVDRIGYLDEAIELALEEAGLTEARVVVYQRPGSFHDNIYSAASSGQAALQRIPMDLRALLQPNSPRFMYLWMP